MFTRSLQIGLLGVVAVGLGMLVYSSGSIDSIKGDSQLGGGAITVVSNSSENDFASSTRLKPAGSKEYRTQPFHFSILYPEAFNVTEHFSTKGGPMLVTFASEDHKDGFQVYSQPYGEKIITQERFDLDEPSGIMDDPQNISIQDAEGVMFWSRDDMGPIREVWFIRKGLLYEVTTSKESDKMIQDIIQTWQFI